MSITVWELLLRLGFAVIAGALIGYEREKRGYHAGLRTHILVCLGSALLVVTSFAFAVRAPQGSQLFSDPTHRLMAGVVTGIGFLGAGTIIKHGNIVRGLTTAASIWVASAIGLSVGAGAYVAAGAALILTYTTLKFLSRVDDWIEKTAIQGVLRFTTKEDKGVKEQVLEALDGLDVVYVSLDTSYNPFEGIVEVKITLDSLTSGLRSDILKRIAMLDGVTHADWR